MAEEGRTHTKSAPPRETEPGRRGLMRGILAYRFASFGLMVALASMVELRSPAATWPVLAAFGAWILAVSWLHAWEQRWVRWVDLAASALLLVTASFLAAEESLVVEPFFAAAYPLSSVMTWAASGGVVGGLAASVALAIPLASSRWLNGVAFTDLRPGDVLGIAVGVIYYVLAGWLIGLFTETMDRAARSLRSANEEAARQREHAARLQEREVLARTIHDSVLQSLAVVHRRGQELAARDRVETGEVADLVRLVDVQERALRSLLREPPADPPDGAVPLRTALEAGAFGIVGVDISVGTIEPAWVSAGAAAEVSAAVHAALDNVVRHASAANATVFGERQGEHLIVSIRDDGVGFEADAAIELGRFGIARSIRGRIEDLGGDVRIESAPGRGTEVELRMPVGAGGGATT